MRFPFRAELPDGYLKKAVKAALKEDMNLGDVTTRSAVPAGARTRAVARVKGKGVIAGLRVFRAVFKAHDSSTVVKLLAKDGDSPRKGGAVAEVRGKARSILTCERVALNYLQHLSGVATETARFVKEVRGTGTRIIDTRKTTPGLRLLEKYAVLKGGGFNHRPTLSDLVMIKDNHIKAAGGLRQAVNGARRNKGVLIEVEMAYGMDLRLLEDLEVDIVMLDNYPIPRLRRAISYVRSLPYKPYVEVSGGVNLGNVRKIAVCGPDFISVGGITHSAPALDIGLDFESLDAGGRA